MAQPWLDADALRPGHRLPNDDGSWAVVEEVVIRPGPLQAFNLTVAETETYFVAGALDADAVWVHNCPKSSTELMDDMNNGSGMGLSSRDRNKLTKSILADVAKQRGWVKNGTLSKKNRKGDYYEVRDSKGKVVGYRSSDGTHGAYEAYDKKGRHLGEEDINGELNTKKQKKDRDLDI